MNKFSFLLISLGLIFSCHLYFFYRIWAKSNIIFSNRLRYNGSVEDFEIAGIDMIYKTAEAEIVNNKIRISSSKVKYPKHVRY